MPPVVTPFGQAGEAIIDETGELNPVTAYDESKMMSKRDISRLAGRGRLPTGLFATRNGLWPITTIALRHRSEQSSGPGVYNPKDSIEIRWRAMAADRAQ
jgi:hypothetical protein